VRRCPTRRTRAAVTGIAWLYNNKGSSSPRTPSDRRRGRLLLLTTLSVNPEANVLLTSSFTGYPNYNAASRLLIKDAEAMKKFGSRMVVWDLKAIKPSKVFKVLARRWRFRWSLRPEGQLGYYCGKRALTPSCGWFPSRR